VRQLTWPVNKISAADVLPSKTQRHLDAATGGGGVDLAKEGARQVAEDVAGGRQEVGGIRRAVDAAGGGFGGTAWVYLKSSRDADRVAEEMSKLAGVVQVLASADRGVSRTGRPGDGVRGAR